MVADTDGEALPGRSAEYGERAIVFLQEFTSVFKEGRALRRKLHGPGRPLDKSATEPLFEPLQFQADGSLRRPHGFSRTREAFELRYADEGPDGIQVEGMFSHF